MVNNPLYYWLLQPGETMVLTPNLYDGTWDWDERQVMHHHGTLVPIYTQKPIVGISTLEVWTGHIEGKGVPVQF